MEQSNTNRIANDSLLKSYKSRYVVLLISFLVFGASFFLMINLGTEWLDSNKQINTILVSALLISALTYNIALGMCAQSIQSSVITWVGLNLIFSPFSWLVSMPMMRRKVKNAITERLKLLESYS